ncbi:uncharacterized protein EV422DRAFT_55353 [Fimicolochytrium jonesii]|uniref:uncharacterized protein n=1 Tax=Fimicolochytrium jonesii TaxID=1396493 RepID=UPI0022FECF4D|nr:uncharacterized protein EV422DRAFT_55353 [Fimicolochytrium jonesii]KAI8821139.1 hypothetical protein EV422DRAFT_55353 [Fimicolochytrium jonesii]
MSTLIPPSAEPSDITCGERGKTESGVLRLSVTNMASSSTWTSTACSGGVSGSSGANIYMSALAGRRNAGASNSSWATTRAGTKMSSSGTASLATNAGDPRRDSVKPSAKVDRWCSVNDLTKDWSKAKKFIMMCGLIDLPGSKPTPWPKMVAWLVTLLVVWVSSALAFRATAVNRSSTFWPVCGITVGFQMQAPVRVRLLIPPTVFVASLLISIPTWDVRTASAFAAVDSIDPFLVTLVIQYVANYLGAPGLPFDLTRKRNAAAFGCGIVMSLFTGFLGAYMVIGIISPHLYFWHFYVKWVTTNVNGIALGAPLIVTFTSLRSTNIHCCRSSMLSWRGFLHLFLFLVVAACPPIGAIAFRGSFLSNIFGLFMCYPIVLFLSAVLGPPGSSISTFLAGGSSGLTLSLGKTYYTRGSTGEPWAPGVLENIVAMQMFLVLLKFTSMWMVTILADRDRAYYSVERKVTARTAEVTEALRKLAAARNRAKQANRDKANFLSFLCHELRNPLHAVTNMAEFLLDDMEESFAQRSSSDFATVSFSDDCNENYPSHESDSSDSNSDDRRGKKRRSSHSVRRPCSCPVVHNCATSPASEEPERGNSYMSLLSREQSQTRSARAMKLSSEYMLAIVNDVLDLDRFEGGRVRLELSELDFHHLLDASFACAEELVRKHGISFTSVMEANVPTRVEIDPTRMQQLLNNLVSNAYKFTPAGGEIIVEAHQATEWWAPQHVPAGGVSFTVPVVEKGNSNNKILSAADPQLEQQEILDQISITVVDSTLEGELHPRLRERRQSSQDALTTFRCSALTPGTWTDPSTGIEGLGCPPPAWRTAKAEWTHWNLIEITVTDTGVGIGSEVMESLFQPYTPAAVTSMREYGGSGLGIPIAEKIVRLMGGQIAVETEVGKGTRFAFVIPLKVLDVVVSENVNCGSSQPLKGPVRRRRSWKRTDTNPLRSHSGYKDRDSNWTGGQSTANMDRTTPVSPLAGPTRVILQHNQAETASPTRDGPSMTDIKHINKQRLMHKVSSLAAGGKPLPPSPTGSEDDCISPADMQHRVELLHKAQHQQTDIAVQAQQNWRTSRHTTPVYELANPLENRVENRTTTTSTTTTVEISVATQQTLSESPESTPGSEDTPLIPGSKSHPANVPGTEATVPRKERILIVDDSLLNRRILHRMLERILPAGQFEITEAENGQEAVDMYKKAQTEIADSARDGYRLIFMDIIMPVMDGYQATKAIRDAGCKIPIVVTTANRIDNPEAQVLLDNAGVTFAIGKPFTQAAIKGILQRWEVISS